jgi:hypothetical protein
MRIMTIRIDDERLRKLRLIGKDEQRSLGFLIRNSIDFWLAKRRQSAMKAERKGKP